MNVPVKRIYEFGPFRLDPDERLLLRSGEPMPLSPKAFETLLLLVQNSGRVVDKGEILKQIWPNTFIEETTLSQNIFTLRRTLGETHSNRQYIETVPKRGYRFIAEVRVSEDSGAATGGHHKRRRKVEIGGMGGSEKTLTSLAVLPLANVADDPEVEYLSDGITESIINNLAQLPQLRVMARSTVFRYKSPEVDAQQVGRDLGEQAILVGRVLKIGDRLSIRMELVDVANGWQLWGEQYNRLTSDIFEVEQEIAEKISANLRLKLTDDQEATLRQRFTSSTEAYYAYLNGRYHWNERTVEGYRKALEYFNQAILIDPNYALAYSGLADTYSLQCIGFQGWLRPSESMPKAKAAALKALDLNDSLAEAHTSLAYIKMYWDWDWSNSEKEFQRAIELNPKYAHAHHWYSHHLMGACRLEKSLAESERAVELDPLEPTIQQHLGWHYLYARQYDEAIQWLQKTLESHPNFYPMHLIIGMAYAQVQEYSKAIEHHRKALELEGTAIALGFLGYTLAVSGEKDEALKILRELMEQSKQSFILPYYIAIIHIGLDQKEQAFEWLERAFNERAEWICALRVAPELDSLRSDQRLTDMIRRAGIPA
jgi:TolB-like protein/Tfp pilus assembly protein PilF